jgi:alpha-amylase/alpha-mannosidase (GH57 family)
MAALLERHADVHLTINLTPVLLRQIEDYVERSFTDRALELTRAPARELRSEDREDLCCDERRYTVPIKRLVEKEAMNALLAC